MDTDLQLLFFLASVAFVAFLAWRRRFRRPPDTTTADPPDLAAAIAERGALTAPHGIEPIAPLAVVPAQTVALDALADLDSDLRALVDLLDRCSTPNLSHEREMADQLAHYIGKAADDATCVQTEVTVKGTAREAGARIDMVFRRRVAIEVKRREADGTFTAATIQRAIGQVRKYAGLWTGPVVLVLLSRYKPNMDARIKAELASPELARRPGGPVLAIWKWRGQAIRVVRPTKSVPSLALVAGGSR